MYRDGNHDPRRDMSDSAFREAGAYATPRVAQDGGDRLSAIVGVAALAMLGVFVFNQLSAGRQTASVESMMDETRAQLAAAQADMEAARREAEQARAEARRAEARAAAGQNNAPRRPINAAPETAPTQASLRSPALVIDNSSPRSTDMQTGEGTASALAASVDGLTASDVFANRIAASGAETVSATRISDPSRVAPQGTIIAGVLETAINSDLPGYARAIVSEDIRSLDNRNILIPRGSRLIGQYRSGLAIGESRAFVIWTRLLTPEGISIELASPATDTLGRAGLAGKVNRHFFQRFGSAILLSVIDVGASALVYDNNSAIVIGSTSEAQALAAQALSQQMNIPPTVKVKQGSEIRIFLARDLFFPDISEAQGLRP